MANTGVLPFVRGVDFTQNNFSDGQFPTALRLMTGVQWLKMDRTQLAEIPEELGKLLKLEYLSLKNNRIEKLFGELCELGCLRSLNLRHNHIKSSGVPPELFQLDELTTLDLSHNRLKEVPEGMERAKNVLVLNLSHNQIETIPTSLFIHLTDLLYLDLSHNRLETLPPQTRRLANLQTLNLSHNPLELFQLRQLPSLQHLEVLHMANTQRTAQNFPTFTAALTNLVELDLSQNALHKCPAALYSMPNLRRLNLSSNELTELSAELVDTWLRLETLNLSRNQLRSLPPSICRLAQLRRLYLNDNRLDFDGIPSGIGKLGSLETFSASNNQLEMVPEGLCRCGSLKRLNLSGNRLITLPDAIHLLSDLDQLDLRNNPDLIMPPKPAELQKGAGIEFYNIDFSLQHQLRLAGANGAAAAAAAAGGGSAAAVADANGAPAKDPLARKQRLRRGLRNADADKDSAKILQGMADIAKEKDAMEAWDASGAGGNGAGRESVRPKRWDESLEKPPLDYSEIFEEDDGQLPGLTVWEIENFLPNKIDEVVHGKFYEGDCYIVLRTVLDDNGQLAWHIYFWIGQLATLDKKACAAIHAVNLRNYLGALCRTIREEQADESDEFLALFDTAVTYIEGGRTATGFFTVEDAVYVTRMYRVHGAGASIHLEPVAVEAAQLDPRYVFVLDCGEVLHLWFGKRSKNTIKSKARLMVEKINRNERKNRADIVQEMQGDESAEWWRQLAPPSPAGSGEVAEEASRGPPVPLVEHVAEDFVPRVPRLYQVQLGMGYLELPQVEEQRAQLQHTLLHSKNVYILDCHLDLFVWFGKKSTRLVRAAAVKLSQELFNMIERPAGLASVTRVQEGTETQIFKSKFAGWEEIIAVDFTRTAASVAKTGADLTKWARQQETRADLAALFMPRQPAMTVEKATQLEEDWNMDLDVMEAFVWEGKKFVRLPDEELGQFHTDACYVFLCRYCIPPEEEEEEEEEVEVVADGSGRNGGGGGGGAAGRPKHSEAGPGATGDTTGPLALLANNPLAQNQVQATAPPPEDEIQCVVYFWQGRQAGNMAWLTFTFTLQKKFKALFGEELEVVRIHQQQENLKFMAHFKKKFIIKNGRRNERLRTEDGKPPVEFYHLRSNGSALCTRLIQIRPEAVALNSAFCYILFVPFETADQAESGIVYVWLGSKASEEETKLIQEIAEEMFNNPWVSLQILNEGEEPENFFWVALGGRKPYDTDADYMQYTRLFRCSNEKGYFTVAEKCTDFCQDDLADDDIMILDNGEQIFLWLGARCSEVEVKLAYKSAQVYNQHMRIKQPEKPRKLFLTRRNNESKRFTKCFHGWGFHKQFK